MPRRSEADDLISVLVISHNLPVVAKVMRVMQRAWPHRELTVRDRQPGLWGRDHSALVNGLMRFDLVFVD
ncbi:MAG: hypothetical protein VX871_11445, partial [Pseudomonadota bacterium]|nr:hypothetical protein [Pseudomonadota bacterium]